MEKNLRPHIGERATNTDFRKPIQESRAFIDVPILGSDKVSYQQWSEAIQTAFEQFRPGARNVLERVEQLVRGYAIDKITGEQIDTDVLAEFAKHILERTSEM